VKDSEMLTPKSGRPRGTPRSRQGVGALQKGEKAPLSFKPQPHLYKQDETRHLCSRRDEIDRLEALLNERKLTVLNKLKL
jgi:hypothetical protein